MCKLNEIQIRLLCNIFKCLNINMVTMADYYAIKIKKIYRDKNKISTEVDCIKRLLEKIDYDDFIT